MSPEVIRLKNEALQEVLIDLKPHVSESRAKQRVAHYEIERQVQLAVDLSIGIGRRILSLKKVVIPEASRDVFLELSKLKLISKGLANSLARAVGLRNILVHEYDEIDDELFFSGLKSGYKSLVQFSKIAEKFGD